jgi:general secretion pathway protein A
MPALYCPPAQSGCSSFVYGAHFGLQQMPFSITPDPAYLYLSPRHQEALGHLLYGTGQYGGFVQLTGEVGTGKTTVIRALMAQPIDDVDVAMVHHPRLSEREFLASICDELGIANTPDATLKQLIDALTRHLLASHAAGRRTVLIIDEAQNLDPVVLEQVRLLTNLETHTEKLLRIMLVGQPELNDLLARPDLRQLAQRITARFHLTPLAEAETAEYVRHRLRVAGVQHPLFTAEALNRLHHESEGVPRLINVIADRALMGAYAAHLTQVDAPMVARAAEEALGHQHCKMPPRTASVSARSGFKRVEAILPVAALLLAAFLLWRSWPDTEKLEAIPVADKTETPPVAEPQPIAAVDPVAPVTETASEPAERPPEPVDDDYVGLSDFDAAMLPLPVLLRALAAEWDAGLELPEAATVCLDLQPQGYECHRDSGGLERVVQLGRPALIELDVLDARQHLLVHWVNADTLGAHTPDGVLTVDRETVELLATGGFLTLFARPIEARRLDRRSTGSDVAWLDQRLAELLGEPVPETPATRFDAAMERRVKRFQAEQQLAVDGVVGSQTLVVLTRNTPPIPNLEPPDRVAAP